MISVWAAPLRVVAAERWCWRRGDRSKWTMLAAARLVLQCVRLKLHDSGAEVLARRLCQCVCKRAMLCCVCFFHVALAGRFLSLLRRMSSSSSVTQLELRQPRRRIRGNRSCHHKQKNNPTRSAASCQYGEVLVVSVFSLMIWGAGHRGAGHGRTGNYGTRFACVPVMYCNTRHVIAHPCES